MRKNIITKILLISLLLVTLCFLASCGKKESKKETSDEAGTVHVLNDFEKVSDLYSFKPTVTHTIATMDIVGKDAGQVREGNGSLKYDFQKGNWPEILLYVKQSSYPKLDIGNLNKVSVSVYNDTDTPVEATLSVIVTGKATLLAENYTLEANAWNDLDFRLSALACKFNVDKIVGFSIRIAANEEAVFYIDNWTATMGAENTDEDNKWEPLLNEIIERIDNLPKEIALSDGEELEELYMDYVSLPDLYRNIVPNYDVLREAIAVYAELKIASEEEGLETRFLVFDEFYGIGQIENDVNGAYPILYQTDVKYGEEAGSIMITFDGSTQESYFAYTTPLDAALYDYVEMSFFNEDIYRKVIYFNWNQYIVVEPDTWGTIKIPGEEFRSTGRIIVDTIDESGIRINSSGKVYFSALKGTRRDLLTELQKLPKASDFVMPRDIKYLTLIENTMELYNKLPDSAKANIPEELITNLERCYAKIDGYRTVFDTTTEDIQFGTPDCKSVGEAVKGTDDQYGPIFTLKYTAVASGDYAAGFQFNKDFSDSKNMFFYIYNPKNAAQIMYLYADGNWKDLGARTLEPGWNEIQIPSDVSISDFIFGLFPKGANIVGEWKVTSIYEVADKIIDAGEASEVKALIESLPGASTISMPRDLKYVTAISAAKEMYDALSAEAKAQITASLKNKLDACLAAIKGYSAVINAITDDMTVGTPDCVCSGTLNRKTDSEYGTVFELNITAISTGDYAAGFQVNKDISDSKNIFVYIYNPTASAQTMYMYADPSWKDLGPQALNPGWNKVELPNDVNVEQYVFGLFPKGAKVTGEWKITSFYALSDAIVAKELASEAEELLKALPEANTITMPADIKYVAQIEEAKAAYEALSKESQNAISSDLKAKLTSCLTAISGYKAVINARTDEMSVGTPDCVCSGVMNRKTDSEYGPVFGLNITAISSGDYAAGFQVNKDISDSKNIFVYIYNPTASAQTMFMYADPSWKDIGAQTLNPGWNKIEISNDIKIEQYVFGLFPKAAKVTGEWKITSFYAVSDAIVAKELASETKALLQALPNASQILMPQDIKYLAMIDEAKAAYDALSAESQKTIVTDLVENLNACIEKVAGYSTVVNARIDDMTVGTPDCVCDGVMNRKTDNEYGPVFGLHITEEATVNYSGGFQINKNLSDSSNIFFYMYNPLEREQVMFLYADGNWTDLGAKTLAPGWNKVELPNDKKINNYVFGLFPLGEEVAGEWKITSFYSVSDEIINQEQVAEIEAMIDALPEAEEINMPNDVKHIDPIRTVKDLFDALVDAIKSLISPDRTEKLENCVDEVADYEIVVDAKTDVMMVGSYDCACGGEVTRETSGDYGPAFNLNLTEEATVNYSGGFQINKNLSESQNIFFFMYNPLDHDQTMFLYADGSWTDMGARTLAPGWNMIELPNDKKVNSFLFGLFPLGEEVSGEWKITSFYAVAGESSGEDDDTGEEDTVEVIAYSSTSNHRFDYYNDETNAAYAEATLGDVEVAGKTAKWSATVNVTQQNGGFARAYQGLELTVDEIKAYKEAGYTHLRIPYYLEAPADTTIYVHSDGWEWNYKKAADAVRGTWTYFDYPIDDLLLVPNAATGKTVLEGINGANGAYGLINIGVNATGTYKLYLGECEMFKPEAKEETTVIFTSALNHRFDYYNDVTNAAYAEATLGDVEIAGETAKWSATVNVTQQNGGFARAYQALELTVDDLKAYKEAGYTHLRIPYYLEAPADTTIYVHSDGWEWNYKKAADAVRGTWTYLDYPIDDLLLVPNVATGKTVLEGINTANGAYGLINIGVNATGVYKLYFGECTLIAK